jgi:CMP-N,N'-diacetyllegionaminic acid synthase
VPRKNVRRVAGEPLISWTWTAAKQATGIDRLLVSTDDSEIIGLARAAGVEAPFMRPAHLSSDTASAFSVAEHAMAWMEEREGYQPDVLLWLQPTSPLRTAHDIEAALALHRRNPGSAVVSVCEAEHHPMWTFLMNAEGVLRPLFDEARTVMQRQELPQAYRVNGALYVVPREKLVAQKTLEPEPTLGYLMPQDRSVDVDSEWDLYLADLLLADRLAAARSGI